MIKLQINNKTITLNAPTPLKELVSDLRLPCGGKGICGKCKITAPALPITPKDKKFFTATQLEQGQRIACDKIIEQNCSVTYTPTAHIQEHKKIEHCSMFAYLGIQKLTIGILDDDLQETIEAHYDFDFLDDNFNKRLKAKLIQDSLELMEAYGVPQAQSLLISGNALMLASFLGESYKKLSSLDYRDSAFDALSFNGSRYHLPAEDVFVLPQINGYLGSDIISAFSVLEKDCLYTDFSHIPVFAMQLDDGYLVAPFYPLDPHHPLPQEVYLATISYFYSLNPHIHSALTRGVLPFSLPKKLKARDVENNIIEFLSLASLHRKYRTKADKMRRKCNVVNISEEATWQNFFARLCQSCNN